MKKLTRIFVASAIGGAAVVAHASINFMDELRLMSLSESEMASIRGGFVSINDSVINIGLSITTAINGEKVLSTHIADFTINNGMLVSSSGEKMVKIDDPLKHIRVENNEVQLGTIDSDASGFVIQNFDDGTQINSQTIMDVEADMDGYIKQTIYQNRLNNSLLFSSH
ncbi:hypothetical protein [Photobacterium atrarenae]|uniref:Uncharacterized protein n=1 Tax=Photobacterium atrarenae TaxID=865757 RepID=A0ABY5GKJ6_9GAMM|nr:hypothetical protein [Photobacterium atrarenae]UTV29762.1 hypothetical protein NNL38_22400 [Photobacterium atrarenae]